MCPCLLCCYAINKTGKAFWSQFALILPPLSYWFNIPTDFYYQILSAGQDLPVKSLAKINCHFEIDLIGINRLFLFRHFGCTYDARAVVIHNQGGINLLHNKITCVGTIGATFTSAGASKENRITFIIAVRRNSSWAKTSLHRKRTATYYGFRRSGKPSHGNGKTLPYE